MPNKTEVEKLESISWHYVEHVVTFFFGHRSVEFITYGVSGGTDTAVGAIGRITATMGLEATPKCLRNGAKDARFKGCQIPTARRVGVFTPYRVVANWKRPLIRHGRTENIVLAVCATARGWGVISAHKLRTMKLRMRLVFSRVACHGVS